jgi:DNA-binding NtrC family response regulator
MKINGRPKILIVDDDKYIRDSVKGLMTKWQIEADFAENGANAIEEMMKENYGLIMLDMKMDIMDGLEVLRYMNYRNLTIPVILISAYASDKRVEEALKYYPVLCLTKPISPDALKTIIGKYIKIG